MTPEEILRDLRDIHLPEQTAEAAGAGFVLWPAVVVLVLALLGFWLAWRRRSAWRREIVLCLDTIEQDAASGRVLQGWTELAVLLRRIAMQLRGRREVAGLSGDAWLGKLDQLFGSDLFSQGPGRGVAVFPYGTTIERDRDEMERIGKDLTKTIDDLRTHLPKLGRVR